MSTNSVHPKTRTPARFTTDKRRKAWLREVLRDARPELVGVACEFERAQILLTHLLTAAGMYDSDVDAWEGCDRAEERMAWRDRMRDGEFGPKPVTDSEREYFARLAEAAE